MYIEKGHRHYNILLQVNKGECGGRGGYGEKYLPFFITRFTFKLKILGISFHCNE